MRCVDALRQSRLMGMYLEEFLTHLTLTRRYCNLLRTNCVKHVNWEEMKRATLEHEKTQHVRRIAVHSCHSMPLVTYDRRQRKVVSVQY